MGQRFCYMVSLLIAEYILGNPDPVIKFFGINPERVRSAKYLSLDEYDALKEEIAYKAFQALLEIERLGRLNFDDFHMFSQVYYGYSHPRVKYGTCISTTALLLLNSIYEDVKLLSKSYVTSTKNVANAIQNISALHTMGMFCTPMVLFLDTDIRPITMNSGLTAKIITDAVKSSKSNFWYCPSDDLAFMSWAKLKSFVGETYKADPGKFFLGLVRA